MKVKSTPQLNPEWDKYSVSSWVKLRNNLPLFKNNEQNE